MIKNLPHDMINEILSYILSYTPTYQIGNKIFLYRSIKVSDPSTVVKNGYYDYIECFARDIEDICRKVSHVSIIHCTMANSRGVQFFKYSKIPSGLKILRVYCTNGWLIIDFCFNGMSLKIVTDDEYKLVDGPDDLRITFVECGVYNNQN